MTPNPLTTLLTAATTVLSIAAAAVLATAPSATAAGGDVLPRHLRDTGLYAPGSASDVRATVLPFTPQYALWSDGADKRRWIELPPGAQIDARNPDAWSFPPGTRLWKEFSHGGRRVETRHILRAADGRWHFGTYVWTADGSDAVLAAADGIAAMPLAEAPGGRYDIPSREDCLACHEGAAAPVLGFGALQLSSDRDPLAPHAAERGARDVDLAALAARGLLRNLSDKLLREPPRIAAASPLERAALGYLHANCGHCHNRDGAPAPVRLTLAQGSGGARDDVLASAVDAPSRYRPHGLGRAAKVVVPGDARTSVLALRMRSRDERTQMPPLGTRLPDDAGLALVERWIAEDLGRLLPAATVKPPTQEMSR